MIDVHVIISPERAEFHDRCFKSLEGQPINLFKVPKQASISMGRMIGFSLGESEFVSLVDDDDWVEEGAFQACLDYLIANPEIQAVFTSERRHPIDGSEPIIIPAIDDEWSFNKMRNFHPYVHHLVVLRRSCITKHLHILDRFPNIGDQALYHEVAKENLFVHLPIVGYNWVHHRDQVTRKGVSSEWEKYKMWDKYHNHPMFFMIDQKRI